MLIPRAVRSSLHLVGFGFPILPRPGFILMYTRAASLPILYIRNIIPDDMASPLRRSWPIGAGLCAIHPSSWNGDSAKSVCASLVPWRTLCYGAHTSPPHRSMLPSLRGQPTPREGAGQLPALLLDQGQQPGTPPLPASKRAEQSPYNTAQEASSKGGGRSKGLAQDLSTPRNHGGGVAAVSSPPSQRDRKEKAMIARFDHRPMLTALLALTTTVLVVVVIT